MVRPTFELLTYADDELCWREGGEGHLNNDGNDDWIKRTICHKDINRKVGDALHGDGYNFDFDDDANDDYTPLRMWRGKNRLCSVATHCPLNYDNHLMIIHIIL